MILVRFSEINDNNVGTVQMIEHNTTSTSSISDGLYFENITVPAPVRDNGMRPVLRINLKTKELYYDYFIPETIETKVKGLQQENSELKQAVAELTMLMAAAPTA
ncbi:MULTISPECIES: hypothetical protein [Paenibacillus]|uniref:Uncharacterized protein n=1 Tax=Paenibacillus albilobatus TaxID=2716884 RepID=A0A919XIH3_9BACL|nr:MULTISPECIES: hypothetical protein [Paenibacillus]GIO32003.1 hypothetical protein J2TS6_31440 [Paenibacillus albilobatus]